MSYGDNINNRLPSDLRAMTAAQKVDYAKRFERWTDKEVQMEFDKTIGAIAEVTAAKPKPSTENKKAGVAILSKKSNQADNRAWAPITNLLVVQEFLYQELKKRGLTE